MLLPGGEQEQSGRMVAQLKVGTEESCWSWLQAPAKSE